MATNDYKKGMVDGAKPFAEVYNKMAEGLDTIKKDISNDLDPIKNSFDIIIDDLTSIERKRLYDLNPTDNISELETEEKEWIIAGLYTIANQLDTNEHQQEYLRAIQNFLNISNPQDIIELSKIENIEDIKIQKIFFQVFYEFLFLENPEEEICEVYKNIFDHFCLNTKQKNKIRGKTYRIFKAAGLKGIYSKYFYLTSADYNAIEEANKNNYGEDIKKLNLEKVEIKENIIINKGSEIEYSKKHITICSIIECKGTLSFSHCKIKFSSDLTEYSRILLSSGSLFFYNCEISATNRTEDFKIISENKESKIHFDQCSFFECDKFLNVDYLELIIENSEVKNSDNFIEGSYISGKYSNNTTVFKDVQFVNGGYKLELSKDNENCFNISTKNSKFHFCNNIFKGSSNYTAKNIQPYHDYLTNRLFKTENVIFKNNKFIDLYCVLTGGEKYLDCQFQNCIDVYSFGSTIFDNCTFTECRNIIFNLGKESLITKCKFSDCYDNIINSTEDGDIHIKTSIFINLTNEYNESFSFARSNGHDLGYGLLGKGIGKVNTLEDCIFKDSNLKRYLISYIPEDSFCTKVEFKTYGYNNDSLLNVKKFKSYILQIEKCSFHNISFEGGDFIRRQVKNGKGALAKKDTAVWIGNCIGLN